MRAGDVNIWYARLLADQQITYVMEFDRQLAGALDVLDGLRCLAG